MPGLGFTGSIVVGAILGGGMLFYIWRRLRQAESDKARADSLESFTAGERDAKATEAKMIEAAKKAEKEPEDPFGIR
jgi:hypothetical protein